MSPDDLRPATTPVRHPAHAMERLPATVPAAAGLLVISAIVLLEHARRLFNAMTMAEETQGLAAIPPLGQEVPAALIEAFVGGGLLIAAFALVRRSRLAMIFAASVQVIVALDALLRIVQGHAVAPAIAVLVLAILTAGTLLGASTRGWCDEPVWPPTPR